MRYRPFGRTGLQVSELVFGGGWVGGILIHQDDATKSAAIERALDAGINWIDTAPSYGDGESERALGWLLQDVADRPYLSTKVRLDLSRLDDITGQVRRSIEESLSRLRCDSVELLQLHNPIGPQNADQRIGVDQVL
ncbi:MAG TPA: aldo/keto reductase, partial [Geminicoccaceae bacterium]